MSTFKYGDEWVKTKDIMVLVPSIMVGIGILKYVRILAGVTETIDGWVSIVISGMITMLMVWFVTKLAALHAQQSFLEYASSLVSKPVAVVLTFLFSILGICLTAYEVQVVGIISELYLFNKTPVEVITLSYLWVVVYAISGSRVGIFRLNALFLPVAVIAVIILVFFSIGFMEVRNVLPIFKTDVQGYWQGIMKSPVIFSGIGIIFFYVAYVKKPQKAPRMAIAGVGIVVLLYILIYVTSIAVFGPVTEVIRLPLIELAKSIEIPGGFFERLESVFLVIWMMVIFISTMIAFDVAVLAITLIFPKINKKKIVLGLTPLIYLISTLPGDYKELENFGEYINYYEVGLTAFVTILLWGMYLIKGVKNRGK